MKFECLVRSSALIGLLVPTVAHADDAEARKAEAERLFAAGQTAFEKNDSTQGCALMRQSLGLFAVANALFNVAQCDEKDGKLRSAYDHWRRGLSLVDPRDQRVPVVKTSIETLEARMPRIHVVVPETISNVHVVLDEVEIAPDKLTEPVFVDAGKHAIVFKKDGHEDKRAELVLAEAERTEVVAELGKAVEKGPDVPKPKPVNQGLRTGGFVALGLGGAGIIGAAITGAWVVSKQTAIDTQCPKFACTPEGLDLVEQRSPLVVTNAVLWGVGIAGVGAGVAMLLASSPKSDAQAVVAAPLVLPNGGGIGLSGRF